MSPKNLNAYEGLFGILFGCTLKTYEKKASLYRCIEPVRRKLENQKDDLLRFAELIDQRLMTIAHEHAVSEANVRKVFLLEDLKLSAFQRGILEEQIREVLRHKFYAIQKFAIFFGDIGDQILEHYAVPYELNTLEISRLLLVHLLP